MNQFWQYQKQFGGFVSDNLMLEINALPTPVNLIKDPFGNKIEVYLKREDLNRFGSFKERSLTYWIAAEISSGIKNFAISSSGNAAIAAAGIINEYIKHNHKDLKLQIFISDKITIDKYQRLDRYLNDNIKVHKSTRPKSDCIKFSKEHNCKYLRGSTDDNAIIGYKSIAFELKDQLDLNYIDSIFICTSSGASAIGLYSGLKSIGLQHLPVLYIIQSQKINPISKEFNPEFKNKEISLLSAISDRTAHRKNQVLDLIKQTHGFGFIIEDEEARAGLEELEKQQITPGSYEMGACLYAVSKAINNGFNIKNPLCIMSGL